MLSVEQIAAGLGDRFHLLTGGTRTALPRHQTLRASVEWSHELLSEPERAVSATVRVLRRLHSRPRRSGVRGRCPGSLRDPRPARLLGRQVAHRGRGARRIGALSAARDRAAAWPRATVRGGRVHTAARPPPRCDARAGRADPSRAARPCAARGAEGPRSRGGEPGRGSGASDRDRRHLRAPAVRRRHLLVEVAGAVRTSRARFRRLARRRGPGALRAAGSGSVGARLPGRLGQQLRAGGGESAKLIRDGRGGRRRVDVRTGLDHARVAAAVPGSGRQSAHQRPGPRNRPGVWG